MAGRIRVRVMPKKSVLDPQGVAVRDALSHLGASEFDEVRVGKVIELSWSGERPPSDEKIDEVCREFLSNPVIEDFEIERETPAGQG